LYIPLFSRLVRSSPSPLNVNVRFALTHCAPTRFSSLRRHEGLLPSSLPPLVFFFYFFVGLPSPGASCFFFPPPFFKAFHLSFPHWKPLFFPRSVYQPIGSFFNAVSSFSTLPPFHFAPAYPFSLFPVQYSILSDEGTELQPFFLPPPPPVDTSRIYKPSVNWFLPPPPPLILGSPKRQWCFF